MLTLARGSGWLAAGAYRNVHSAAKMEAWIQGYANDEGFRRAAGFG
jgi:hypothetical protein